MIKFIYQVASVFLISFGSMAGAQAAVITQLTILNSGFETIGFDAGDGLRSADHWVFNTAQAARAFDGRDGISTGSNGYMRVITEGDLRGETSQDIVGSTEEGTLYTFGATAYNSPLTDTNIVDYSVTMKLFLVGEGVAIGQPPVDLPQPILLDSDTVTISQDGGIAPLAVSYPDADGELNVKLRILFESSDPLATGLVTRGGVDDVLLSTSPVPEPGVLALMMCAGVFALAFRRNR